MVGKMDLMTAYMADIKMIPLVSKQDEGELARKIKSGDNSARRKLIIANLRLVVKIAHGYKGLGLPLMDLVAEGNLGLIRAAEKFEPEKGANFGTYSSWWIKQSIRHALSFGNKTIRIPVAKASKIKKLRESREKLKESLGRGPTDSELVQDTKFTAQVIKRLEQAELKTFSIHNPISSEKADSFEKFIQDVYSVEPCIQVQDSESKMRLRGLIKRLDKTKQEILAMRFGLDGKPPKTLLETSKLIGCSRERVRQIQNESIRILRNLFEDESIDNDGTFRESLA